jgi:hypothetical protein
MVDFVGFHPNRRKTAHFSKACSISHFLSPPSSWRYWPIIRIERWDYTHSIRNDKLEARPFFKSHFKWPLSLLLILWWNPFKMRKEQIPSLQFINRDQTSLLLTPSPNGRSMPSKEHALLIPCVLKSCTCSACFPVQLLLTTTKTVHSF